MKKLFLALLLLPLSALGQCDLEILDFNVSNATITIAFNNTENCGGDGAPDGISEIQFGFQAIDADCNAMNIGWDFPTGLSIPDNNNHPGWLYSATTTESPTNWTNFYTDDIDPPYYAGDTVTFPLDNVYGETSGTMFFQLADCLQYWESEGYSIQAVIWQISYGPTMYAGDGGWAEVGPNGDGTTTGTGIYDDSNFEDNWIIVGPCSSQPPIGCTDPVACNYDINASPGGICVYCDSPYELGDSLCNEIPGYWEWYLSIFPDCVDNPDTIIITYIDTVYIELPPDTVTIIETDTIFVELPSDTIYEVDTITIVVTEVDTIYIQLPPDTVTVTETEFIFITDTIVETEYITLIDTTYVLYTDTVYVYEFIEVDCETGLPCSEVRNEECNIYIPNAFTPDNDGFNDAWEIVLDPECWTDIKARVVSRWGNIVWQSNDPNNLIWDGSYEGGDYYVQEEMYTWFFQARKIGTAEIKDLRGHVTVIR